MTSSSGNNELTVAEVADQLGISQDRVRQIDCRLCPRIVTTPGGYQKRFYNPKIVDRYAEARARILAERENYLRDWDR